MHPDEPLSLWFAARLPGGWCEAPPEVVGDRDELLVVADLPAPDADLDPVARADEVHRRIQAYREATRAERMAVADQAEARFGRKVSWAARCDGHLERFTVLSVPVMTRLHLPERRVLDTLIDAGVARSRSEALAWCVRLVAEHEGDWIEDLRAALATLAEARDRGPHPGAGAAPDVSS